MEQIERITQMEQALDDGEAALEALEAALERYAAVRAELAELEAYYSSPAWRKDYEDDSAGKLPKDLKRGVLSEDAVYDLLSDHDRLRQRMGELCINPAPGA